jgi:hypothetical protein
MAGAESGGRALAARKNSMGWKFAFALLMVSGAALAILARRGTSHDEGAVEREAATQLDALREYLFRR